MISTLNITFSKLLREIAFYSPLRRHLFSHYKYYFTPSQLCFLCQCVEDTTDIEGAICEVGCAQGRTTVFLNKYMDARTINKNYYALDTFSGFVSEDINFERVNRGKPTGLSYACFDANKKKWFDETMRQDNVCRVRSIVADVNVFDLTTLAPLSFSLLDVDLYRPMKKALKELYHVLSPGGIIVVDDCDPTDVRWDGSDQAYKEFMTDIGQAYHVVHGKLGVIRKPTQEPLRDDKGVQALAVLGPE